MKEKCFHLKIFKYFYKEKSFSMSIFKYFYSQGNQNGFILILT